MSIEKLTKDIMIKIFSVISKDGMAFGNIDISDIIPKLEGKSFNTTKDIEKSIKAEISGVSAVCIDKYINTTRRLNEDPTKIELTIFPTAIKLPKKYSTFNVIIICKAVDNKLFIERVFSTHLESLNDKKNITMVIPTKYLLSVRKDLNLDICIYKIQNVYSQCVQIFNLFDADKPNKYDSKMAMFAEIKNKLKKLDCSIVSMNRKIKKQWFEAEDGCFSFKGNFRKKSDDYFNFIVVLEKDRDNNCVHILSYAALEEAHPVNKDVTFDYKVWIN